MVLAYSQGIRKKTNNAPVPIFVILPYYTDFLLLVYYYVLLLQILQIIIKIIIVIEDDCNRHGITSDS